MSPVAGHGFAVDTDALGATVEELARVRSELDALADELAAEVAALQVTWDGEAAAAHATAQGRWDAGFAAMRDALARMRAATEVAHGNYTTAAEVNARMWRDLG